MTMISTMSRRQRLGLGGAALLALGAAGGAGAVSLTRPTVEMAPTLPTTVSHLPATSGIVTVRGRVAAVYGDRFLVQDGTGNALVDAGRRGAAGLSSGSAIMVQGRYENGQLHARFLVDQAGSIAEVGPGPRHDHGAPPPPPPPGGPGTPPPPPGGPGAPPPPPGGPGAPPPPRGGPGVPPPPPAAMAPAGAAAPSSATAPQSGTAPLPAKR